MSEKKARWLDPYLRWSQAFFKGETVNLKTPFWDRVAWREKPNVWLHKKIRQPDWTDVSAALSVPGVIPRKVGLWAGQHGWGAVLKRQPILPYGVCALAGQASITPQLHHDPECIPCCQFVSIQRPDKPSMRFLNAGRLSGSLSEPLMCHHLLCR